MKRENKNKVHCQQSWQKASVMSESKSLYTKWKEYSRSQSLSLMLKLPVMINKFWMLVSVSFRYFKADWLELEYILSKKNVAITEKKIANISMIKDVLLKRKT